MAELTVNIVTPESSAFSGAVSSALIPAWDGEMGVLPGHDIVLALLRGGVTTVTTAQGTKRFVTGRGFVEVGPDRISILTDSCVPAEAADKNAAQRALDGANRTFLEGMDGTEAWSQAEEARETANATLSL